MAKSKRKPRKNKSKHIHEQERPTKRMSGFPMVIDNEPIRREARQVYENVVQKLEDLEKSLETYDRVDEPAFLNWIDVTFGEEIDALRELRESNRRKELFLQRADYLTEVEGMPYANAYSQTKEEEACGLLRENGHSDEASLEGEEWEDDFDEGEPDIFAEGNPFNIPPEVMRDIWARDFGISPEEADIILEEMGWVKESKDRERKLRRLFREIAQILHPDRGQALSGDRWELWIRAQEAYRNKDRFILERISLRLTQEFQGQKINIGWYDEMTSECEGRVERLESAIRELRNEKGWQFTRKNDRQRKALHRKIDRELKGFWKKENRLKEELEQDIRFLEREYERHIAGSSRRRRPKAPPTGQLGFNFELPG